MARIVVLSVFLTSALLAVIVVAGIGHEQFVLLTRYFKKPAEPGAVVSANSRERGTGAPRPTKEPQDDAPPTNSGQPNIVVATVVVSAIFLLDIGVLWVLSKIGGEKLKADVKATINKFGGSIVIAGAGLVGCFLAIAFVGFGGLYLVATIMKQ